MSANDPKRTCAADHGCAWCGSRDRLSSRTSTSAICPSARGGSRMRRREFIGLVAGGVMLLPAAAYAAEVYPTRPIHLMVPYPPGGGTDIVGRLLGEKLSASLKQPIVVDNRGGAGGVLGTEAAAKAAPDGYTLLLVPTSHVINPSIYAKLPYDTVKELCIDAGIDDVTGRDK